VGILVTGATGFIGGHVARELRRRGHEVRALVREGSSTGELPALGVEVVRGDILDPLALRAAADGCTAIMHLAADFRLWAPDKADIVRTNVEGTRQVLQAARAARVSRVVYTSTMAVLQPSATDSEPRLAPPRDLAGPYEHSKWLAEQEVLRAADDGLPCVIVYPTMPVGPGDRKPTPTGKLVLDMTRGRLPFYVAMDINVVPVEDVAVGHVLALELGRLGEGYILGGRNLALAELLSILSRITGRPRPRARVPLALAFAAALVDEGLLSRITGRAPRVSKASVRLARRRLCFSSRKAIEELGLPQTSVEAALERSVSWFRSYAMA
jgi:dihydroflavonol-4-reductase